MCRIFIGIRFPLTQCGQYDRGLVLDPARVKKLRAYLGHDGLTHYAKRVDGTLDGDAHGVAIDCPFLAQRVAWPE